MQWYTRCLSGSPNVSLFTVASYSATRCPTHGVTNLVSNVIVIYGHFASKKSTSKKLPVSLSPRQLLNRYTYCTDRPIMTVPIVWYHPADPFVSSIQQLTGGKPYIHNDVLPVRPATQDDACSGPSDGAIICRQTQSGCH